MRTAVYPERSRGGFTLIELLIVISIIAIISVVGFVNFKGFSDDQVTINAVGQIQSTLRLAQSNATSSTLCNNSATTSWYLNFTSSTAFQLNCNPGGFTVKSYTLTDATVAITGSLGCSIPYPATVSYLPGAGKQTISSSGALASCLQSTKITFTVSNTKNPSASPIPLNISSGGAINVQ